MEISHARPYPFLLSFGWVPIQEGNLMYAHTLRFGIFYNLVKMCDKHLFFLVGGGLEFYDRLGSIMR